MNKKLKKLGYLFLTLLVLWIFVGFEYSPPGYEQNVGLWLPFIKHRTSFQIKFQSQLYMRTKIHDSIPLPDSNVEEYSRYCSIRFGKNLEDCYNILENVFAESVNTMRDKGDEYSPEYYESAIKTMQDLHNAPTVQPKP